MTLLRAVFYLRLSLTTETSTSIARQRQDLYDLAEREGWEVVAELVDDGISGRKARANATEALRMLRAGEVDVFAVWKLDRLSRQGLSAIGQLVDVLDATPGALFVALQDGLRSDQSAWRLIAAVLAEVARSEADNISTRAKSSVVHLRRSGRFAGGVVPYGYRTAPAPDGPGRILVVDLYEAILIREYAERALSFESLTELVADLKARGIPTSKSAYRYAEIAGTDPAGLDRGTWRVTTFKGIWTSDHLLGRVRVDGALLLGPDGLPLQVWDPILDLETMQRLRARISDPKIRTGRRVRRSRLLSGFAWCALCGCKMYVVSSGSQPYYRCSSLSENVECMRPTIMANGLEAYVTRRFLDVAGDWPELVELTTAGNPGATGELAEVDEAIVATSVALTEDDADTAALMARLAILKARRAALRAVPSTETTTRVETGRTLRTAWADAGSDHFRRAMLEEALDHVEVAPRARRGGTFDSARVELFWTS